MTTTSPRVATVPVAVLSLCLLPGCGFGSAGVAALADDGGAGNAPPALGTLDVRGLSIDEPKVPPARLRLLLADAESDPATVELAVVVPGRAEERLRGVDRNPLLLATSRDGITHDVEWDFTAEAGLSLADGFVPGVRVIARLQGGVSREVVVGLGNDAPVISDIQPSSAELRGVAPIRFRVEDSAGDPVDIKVEFRIDGASSWQLARPANLLASDATPEFAFVDLSATSTGAQQVFFWDTDHASQLSDLERTVQLRLTARDSVSEGIAVESLAIRVDNNEAPVVQVDSLSLVASNDQRRGIPLRYSVFDEERDLVRVLFQWRAESEPDFPPLPGDVEAIRAILADPRLMREKHICKPFAAHAWGYAQPIDAQRVRLPELRQRESWLMARGIEGARLQLMRRSVPVSLPTVSSRNDLRAPVGAVPIGKGLSAIVCDLDGSATTRLLEVELATGAVVRTIVAGLAGRPSALALDREHERAVIATDLDGVWMVHEVRLATGVVEQALDERASTGVAGPIRALVSVAPGVALVTAADGGAGGVYRCDWRIPGQPRVVRLVRGLAQPWGIALDPLRDGVVLVAEHDTGRIVSIDLRTRAVEPVPALGPDGGVAFPQVTAIALARAGEMLVVVCNEKDGRHAELRALNRGVAHPPNSGPIGTEVLMMGKLRARAEGLAAGPQDLLLVAHASAPGLTAHGGIEQEREVVAYSTADAVATVAAPFDPAPRANQAWRIPHGNSFEDPVKGSPDGTQCAMLWDAREVPDESRVFFQVRSFDAEEGLAVRPASPRLLAGRFQDQQSLPVSGQPIGAVPADLDGDGDLDIVCASPATNTVTVLLQVGRNQDGSPAYFAQPPLPAGAFPVRVAVGDLDRDGDLDLVSANTNSDDLTVFAQTAPGSFAVQSTLPAGDGPRAVVATDLDGDGDLDLACTNTAGNDVSLYWQSGGAFVEQRIATLSETPFAIAASDLDGDGDVDLAVANRNSSDVTLLRQGPVGTFTLQSVAAPGRPSALVAADVDADGDDDLVLALGLGDAVVVMYQDAPLDFTSIVSMDTLLDPEAVVAADLDGDGDLDFACSNFARQELGVFYQVGPRQFTAQRLVPVGSAPSSVAAADLDGDGDLDLVCANSGRNDLSVILQDAPLSAATAVALPIEVAATGDLDRDGDLDLVGFDASGTLKVVYQEAPRTFLIGASLVGPSSFGNVLVADLDGDGDQDVAGNDLGTSNVVVFRQTGPRQFTQLVLPSPLGPSRPPIALLAADMDGDGRLDLVQGTTTILFGNPNVVIYRQDANGGFPVDAQREVALPLSVNRLMLVEDLDADGDMDIVLRRGVTGVTLLFQESPMLFAAATRDVPFLGGIRVVGMASADLDGNGAIDLVCASDLDSIQGVAFQEASESFTGVVVDSFAEAFGVTPGDLDGDGDLDLLFAGSHLAVALQVGPRVFRSQPTQAGIFPAFLADLDGDGDPDIVARNAVYWGRR